MRRSTFAILTVFALVIGLFAGRQVRAGFDDDLRATAGDLQAQITIGYDALTGDPSPALSEGREAADVINAAAAGDARIRIVYPTGEPLFGSAYLGAPGEGIHDVGGYRVVGRAMRRSATGATFYLQYGKPLDNPRADGQGDPHLPDRSASSAARCWRCSPDWRSHAARWRRSRT